MVSELFLTNERGLKLSTVLSIPDNQEKSPIVILLQGFLGKKDGEKLNSLSSELLKNGFATIRFDYAGHNKSEGNPQTEYLISKIITDVEHVLQFIKNNDRLDSEKIGVWGQSMGGMIATIVASKHDEVKALCSVSSPSTITLDDDLENKIKEWKQKGILERFNSNGDLIKIAYKFVEDARTWNAQDSVKKITAPKLFILGSNDTTVPPLVTKKIFESAQKPKELVEITDMQHEYNQDAKFIGIVNTTSVAFMKKHLN